MLHRFAPGSAHLDLGVPHQANLGYHLLRPGYEIRSYHRMTHCQIYNYYPGNIAHNASRGRGYVFWDAERIEDPIIGPSLRDAADVLKNDFEAATRSAPSPVKRVKGIRLPRSEK